MINRTASVFSVVLVASVAAASGSELRETVRTKESVASRAKLRGQTADVLPISRASAHFVHSRAGRVIWTGDAVNLKTKTQTDYTFAQVYSGSGAATGLMFMALTDTAIGSFSTSSSTLTGELDNTNGLGRAAATYEHTAGVGSKTATLSHTFTAGTCASNCTVRTMALFSAVSGGTMGHVVALRTPRTLLSSDTLAVTITITVDYDAMLDALLWDAVAENTAVCPLRENLLDGDWLG